jgi:hypothetical protein
VAERRRNFPDTGQRRFASFDALVGPSVAREFQRTEREILEAERRLDDMVYSPEEFSRG